MIMTNLEQALEGVQTLTLLVVGAAVIWAFILLRVEIRSAASALRNLASTVTNHGARIDRLEARQRNGDLGPTSGKC
jgi:hypothetical protein